LYYFIGLYYFKNKDNNTTNKIFIKIQTTSFVRTGRVRIGRVRIGRVRTGRVRTGRVRTGRVRTGRDLSYSNSITPWGTGRDLSPPLQTKKCLNHSLSFCKRGIFYHDI